MTSALLFVAVLVLVELSYRRWVRRSLTRGTERGVAETRAEDATVIPMPLRDVWPRHARRSS